MRPSATRAVGEDRLPFISTRGRRNLREKFFFSARKLISTMALRAIYGWKRHLASDDAEELSRGIGRMIGPKHMLHFNQKRSQIGHGKTFWLFACFPSSKMKKSSLKINNKTIFLEKRAGIVSRVWDENNGVSVVWGNRDLRLIVHLE